MSRKNEFQLSHHNGTGLSSRAKSSQKGADVTNADGQSGLEKSWQKKLEFSVEIPLPDWLIKGNPWNAVYIQRGMLRISHYPKEKVRANANERGEMGRERAEVGEKVVYK